MIPLRGGVLALAMLLVGTAPCAAGSARIALPVMGTVLEVTVVADDEVAAKDLCRRAVTVAREWDELLTTWRPEGALEQLNRRAGLGRVAIDPRLAGALQRMIELSRQTGGAFDPAVGGIVRALRGGKVPSTSSLPRLVDSLRIDGIEAELAAGVELDAGGIGKGIALDAIAKLLAAGGARAWYLDFGGSSQLGHGKPDTAHAWIVAIAGQEAGKIHGFVELAGGSLSTSRASPASDPAGATIDPRTGKPVAPPRLATVLATDATTAEAWSTALVVRGRDALGVAQAAGVAVLLDDTDGLTVSADFPLHGNPSPE